MKSEINISSEADAIRYISDGINAVDIEDLPKVVFDGWPKMEINIVGEGYQASLKTRQLESILKLQRTINYQYLIATNKSNRRLSEGEARALELNISIKKGSTEVDVDLAQIFSHLVSANPHSIIVLGLVAAGLIYAGKCVADRYFDSQDRDSENQRRQLEIIDKQIDLFKVLTERFPDTQKLTDPAYDAIDNLSRSADDAERLSINGVKSKRIKKNRKSQEKRDLRYEKGRYYIDDCFPIGVKKPEKGGYQYEFIFADNEGNQLVWIEKKSNVGGTLVHDIESANKDKKDIHLEFEVISKTSRNSYRVIVRSIFRKNNKPKSYK